MDIDVSTTYKHKAEDYDAPLVTTHEDMSVSIHNLHYVLRMDYDMARDLAEKILDKVGYDIPRELEKGEHDATS